MASCNFGRPAGAVYCLCYVVLFAVALSGANAKTVLYNKTGRHLVLTIPGEGKRMSMAFPPGKSVELRDARQQRGVTIQDVQSGAVAGPLDIPDNQALEAVWVKPGSATDSRNAGELQAVDVFVNNLQIIHVGGLDSLGV